MPDTTHHAETGPEQLDALTDSYIQAANQLQLCSRNLDRSAPKHARGGTLHETPQQANPTPRSVQNLRQRLREFLQAATVTTNRLQEDLAGKQAMLAVMHSVDSHPEAPASIRLDAYYTVMGLQARIATLTTLLWQVSAWRDKALQELAATQAANYPADPATMAQTLQQLAAAESNFRPCTDALNSLDAHDLAIRQLGGKTYASILDAVRPYARPATPAEPPDNTALCQRPLPAAQGALEQSGVLPASINNHQQAYYYGDWATQALLFAHGTDIQGNGHHRRYTFSNGSYVEVQAHVPQVQHGRSLDYPWQGYTARFYGSRTEGLWGVLHFYGEVRTGQARPAAGSHPTPDGTCNMADAPKHYVWRAWHADRSVARRQAPQGPTTPSTACRRHSAAHAADLLVQGLAHFGTPQSSHTSTSLAQHTNTPLGQTQALSLSGQH